MIVLCTLGTRGDVEPFLALCAALRKGGYEVALLSNRNWAQDAAETGAEFYAIAEEDDPQSGRDDYRFYLSHTSPSFRKSFDLVAGWAAEKRPMMLVYRINMLGMHSAAERFGIPNGRVVLQPCAIKSYLRPPWPMSELTRGWLGGIGRKVVVPALYTFAELKSPYRRHTNSFRRSVGLAPQSLFRRWTAAEDFILMMCPKWYAMPQGDWPDNTYLVGFPFSKRNTPDVRLEQFIERNGPPIVFTPGTGVTNTAGFFERAAEALDFLKVPGVFLSRFVPQRYKDYPHIACHDYADLGWLLPQCRGIFHHGGIGSTAQALRAGVTQVIIPGRFDQPDNAMRVALLGLGAAVLSDRFSGRDWAELFLRTSRDRHIKSQLSTAMNLMVGEDGVANCVRIIDYFVRERFGAKSHSCSIGETANRLARSDRIWSTVT